MGLQCLSWFLKQVLGATWVVETKDGLLLWAVQIISSSALAQFLFIKNYFYIHSSPIISSIPLPCFETPRFK